MRPLTYAIRNLFRDPGRLLQTVGGSALVVLLVIAAIALNHGMEQLLQASGSSKNVILVGTGSEESVERSEVHLDAEAAEAIAHVSLGDLRKAITSLQGAASLDSNVTRELVYETTATAPPEE